MSYNSKIKSLNQALDFYLEIEFQYNKSFGTGSQGELIIIIKDLE